MFRLPLWPVRSPLRSIRRVLSPYRVVKPHRRGPLARRALLWAVAIYGVAHLLLAVVAASSRWIRDPIYTDKRDKLVRLQRQYPASRERVVFLGTSRVGNGYAAGHMVYNLSSALLDLGELDEALQGVEAGAELEFDAAHLSNLEQPDAFTKAVLQATSSSLPSLAIVAAAFDFAENSFRNTNKTLLEALDALPPGERAVLELVALDEAPAGEADEGRPQVE